MESVIFLGLALVTDWAGLEEHSAWDRPAHSAEERRPQADELRVLWSCWETAPVWVLRALPFDPFPCSGPTSCTLPRRAPGYQGPPHAAVLCSSLRSGALFCRLAALVSLSPQLSPDHQSPRGSAGLSLSVRPGRTAFRGSGEAVARQSWRPRSCPSRRVTDLCCPMSSVLKSAVLCIISVFCFLFFLVTSGGR